LIFLTPINDASLQMLESFMFTDQVVNTFCLLILFLNREAALAHGSGKTAQMSRMLAVCQHRCSFRHVMNVNSLLEYKVQQFRCCRSGPQASAGRVPS
jgi:hypothetical protein